MGRAFRQLDDHKEIDEEKDSVTLTTMISVVEIAQSPRSP